MEDNLEYFPTPAYRRAAALMRSILVSAKDHLDSLAVLRHDRYAIDGESFRGELPWILGFCGDYQRAFMNYLSAVLPQQPHGVRCGAECGNCCHHYPMSVEPFELVGLYAQVRKNPDLLSFCESCLFRTKTYYSLLEKARAEGAEDPEDRALVLYFKKSIECPFILPSKNCGVYGVRPVTCRMYFSETPAEFCVPEYLLTEKNRSFVVYLPDEAEELIAGISAHFSPLTLPDGLYEGFLAMNGLEADFSNLDLKESLDRAV